MNNWCICLFFPHIFTGDLIFKGLTARRIYKSFGVKGLNITTLHPHPMYIVYPDSFTIVGEISYGMRVGYIESDEVIIF
jgi:hypothetical protein